jgi:hypothetical protein
MSEANGIDDLRKSSLLNWWLVDALDGRRWIGRIVDRGARGSEEDVTEGFPLLKDELELQPAFEIGPDRALCLAMVPQQQVDPMTGKTTIIGQQAQTVPIQAFGLSLIGNFEKNGFPSVFVRYASRTHLGEWGQPVRDKIARAIKMAIETMDASLAPPSPEGSREKVR